MRPNSRDFDCSCFTFNYLQYALAAGWFEQEQLHIASLIYAIVIESVPRLPCPLSLAETWLEARAGIEPAHGPFLVRVLDAVVYPDLPELVVVGGAVVVCVGILGVYLRRYLLRNACSQW